MLSLAGPVPAVLVAVAWSAVWWFAGAANAEQALSPADASAHDAFGHDLAAAGDVAILGAPNAGLAGQAYVYRFDGSQWVEEDVLTPSDGAAGDGFGSNVAIRGDVAAVTRDADNGSVDPVYVFREAGGSWSEEEKLLASDGMGGDFFGEDVAVGDDQILVGAHGASGGGRVYVFEWNGSSWSETQTIPPPAGASAFGLDLAIDSASPDRVLIGVSASAAPESHVFDGGSWVFEASFPDFGGYTLARTLAVDGDLAVFNAVAPAGNWGACTYRHDGSGWQSEQCFSPPDGSVGDGVGADGVAVGGEQVALGWASGDQVLVYEHDALAGWELMRRLEPPVGLLDDSNFGTALALADADLLVGSSLDDAAGDGAGRAWAIDRPFAGQPVFPTVSEAGEFLGRSLGCDGTRMIAGAALNGDAAATAGSAVIFARSGARFLEEQRLFAGDAEASDRFGQSVDVAGELALVGAYLEDTGASNAGAAYAYRFDGSSWGGEQKLQLASPGVGDQFGNAVALGGDRAAVGAHGDDPVQTNAGSVSVYRDVAGALLFEQTLEAGDPTMNAFLGASVDLDGEWLVAGAPGPSAGGSIPGAAYLYRRSGTLWTQEEKLAPAGLVAGDRFGASVAVGAGVIAVGAPRRAAGGSLRGSVFVYRFDGLAWSPVPEITASDATDGDQFGSAVAVDGDDLLVGMLRTGGSGDPDPGSPVLRFRWDGGAYAEVERFTSPDGTNRPPSGDGFGAALALAGADVCIAAPNDRVRDDASGTLYRFAASTVAIPALPAWGLLSAAGVLALLARRRSWCPRQDSNLRPAA
ncbi:MAG: hypothetical protein ACQGVC_04730 [Myxococcota bacterium]